MIREALNMEHHSPQINLNGARSVEKGIKKGAAMSQGTFKMTVCGKVWMCNLFYTFLETHLVILMCEI